MKIGITCYENLIFQDAFLMKYICYIFAQFYERIIYNRTSVHIEYIHDLCMVWTFEA